MMRRLLALAVGLSCGLPAFAQSESHMPIPRTDAIDPTQLLADKLRQSKLNTDLGGLLRQLRNSGLDFSSLSRQLEANPQLKEHVLEILKGIDLSDPKFGGIVDEAVRRSGKRIDANTFKEQLQNLQSDARDPPGAGSPLNPDGRASRSFRESNPSASATPVPPRQPLDPAVEAARQAWARDIAEWANRFPKDHIAAPLRNSPAFNSLLRDLAEAARNATASGGDGIDVQLARLQTQWESARSWLPGGLGKSFEWHIPEIGERTRHLRLPNIDLTGSSASRLAAPALGTIADLLPVLCAVAIAFVVLMVVRRMRIRSAARLAAAELGPWPVDPASISSRDELIRAFDYLSLLRCGPAARSWHHRAVAARLGHEATPLADLYEQARYAPDAELQPPAFVAARTLFSRLSGATA